MGLILLPTVLRAAEPDLRGEISRQWAEWNGRFSSAVREPSLGVRYVPATSLPGKRGRYRSGRIELNQALAGEQRVSALRHELAHAYLDFACPRITDHAALLSEAFALHSTGEAVAGSFQGRIFPYSSSAREFVLRLAASDPGDSPPVQAALGKLLSLSEQRPGWEKYFQRVIADCGGRNFSLAKAVEGFRAQVRGHSAPEIPTSVDFLLVDGLSFETLAREGKPFEKRPTGSLLKPTFFGLVPDLLESRTAGDSPLWDCPTRRELGRLWTWEKALLKSCNGFFVGEDRERLSWAKWNEAMALLKVGPTPKTMEERIGLVPTIRLNLPEAVRVYAWLARTSPVVVDTLKRTAVEGTLSGLADSSWFSSRGIALKTGTVSDLRGVAAHAWIAAVGPREKGGDPAYYAVIRGTGLSTHDLLGKLKERLRANWKYPSRLTEVQILGLYPSVSLSVGCRSDGPLLEREAGGSYRLRPSGWLASEEMKEAHSYSCPGDAIRMKTPGGDRDYWGTLRITGKLEASTGELPKEARAARARQGSRFVLKTSERHYVVDTLLSEFPTGHAELMTALALVIRHNAHVPRHGDRPLCDTTHCQTFGRGQDVAAASRARIERIVDGIADKTLSVDPKEWLPFHLGGMDGWSTRRGEGEIRVGLNLREKLRQILKQSDGNFELVSDSGKTRLACETVRNQLKLLSCPDSVTAAGDGWVFRGRGEGHGMGLDLTLGNVRAGAGENHGAILGRFYPEVRVVASGG